VLLRHREGLLLSFHIGEVIQPLENLAQHWNREGFGEDLWALVWRR
jgi:hypothetical protein